MGTQQKIILQVGHRYRTRDGRAVRIIDTREFSPEPYRFLGQFLSDSTSSNHVFTWTAEGCYDVYDSNSYMDLIEEIPSLATLPPVVSASSTLRREVSIQIAKYIISKLSIFPDDTNQLLFDQLVDLLQSEQIPEEYSISMLCSLLHLHIGDTNVDTDWP